MLLKSIPDTILFFSWIIIVDCLLVYAFITLTYNPHSLAKRFIPYPIIMGLLFILSVFGYASSDYGNYIHVLGMIEQYTIFPSIEPIYWGIGALVDYRNGPFRLLTFTVIYLLLYVIIKKYSVDKDISVSLYILVYFFIFSTIIRAALCDMIFYIGVLCYFKKRTTLRLVAMLICVGLAFLFHKSAFILYLVLLLSIFRWKKTFYKFVIYLFPIFVILSFVVTSFIFANYFEESSYAGSSHTDGSRSAMISQFLSYFYWFGLLSICMIKTKDYIREKSFIGWLSRITFWFGYISIVLMFNPGSHYLYIRTLYHGCIPILLLMTLVFVKSTPITRKRILVFLLIGFIQLQFSLYLMYVYSKDMLNANTYIVW